MSTIVRPMQAGEPHELEAHADDVNLTIKDSKNIVTQGVSPGNLDLKQAFPFNFTVLRS